MQDILFLEIEYGIHNANQESFASNLYNTYERLGFVDWLPFSTHLRNNSFDQLSYK